MKKVARVRTEVDRFILAGLKNAGLAPSPEADRRKLIRRVTYDLTGLPPTAEEVEAFLDPRYLNYVVETIDGEILSGMIQAEGAGSVTVHDGRRALTVPRSRIARMKTTGTSVMPDGLDKGLTSQDLADILEFLKKD